MQIKYQKKYKIPFCSNSSELFHIEHWNKTTKNDAINFNMINFL